MCGRFTQHYTWAQVQEFLSVIGAPLNLRPRYNIAPTTEIDLVHLDQNDRRELVRMRWGLVPGWWLKSLKDVPATFNARAETVAEKPMFRTVAVLPQAGPALYLLRFSISGRLTTIIEGMSAGIISVIPTITTAEAATPTTIDLMTPTCSDAGTRKAITPTLSERMTSCFAMRATKGFTEGSLAIEAR